MVAIQIKNLKRYKRRGRWYNYHRPTGIRIRAEYGSAEFFAEIATLDRVSHEKKPTPGTLGEMIASYRLSPRFKDLAPLTQRSYSQSFNLFQPLYAMPLSKLTPPFVAGLRDKLATERGRRTSNLALAVLSVVCAHGREFGLISENPVMGVKRVRRLRDQPKANRPWSQQECRSVLECLPPHLAVPVAVAMFTGLRQGDVLSLRKGAIRNGQIWRQTSKTGQAVSLPVHPDLARILAAAPKHDAITITATSNGTLWTSDGFRASFNKAMRGLVVDGKIGGGLTFHGLRHTVGTALAEAGVDLDTIRRFLGQKSFAMAKHYSEGADTSEQMSGAVEKLDPLGSKKRTSGV